MEVGGVGGSAAHVDALAKLAETPRVSAPVSNAGVAAAVEADSVANVLEQLVAPQISNLIQDIETHRQAFSAEPAGDLLSRAVASIHAGDVPRALSSLAELVHMHPGRAEALASEPGLIPIQNQVDTMMQRLTATARVDAEQKIESANHLMQSGGHGGGHGGAHRVEMNPQDVVAVAERLLESGRYPNVVMSADLAQAVIEYYGPFPVAGAGVALAGRGARESIGAANKSFGNFSSITRGVGAQILTRAGLMWHSAPLLLMLIVWMAMGLLVGLLSLVLRALSVSTRITEIFFDLWAMGFLGLIGFGFYRSIRHLRFR